MSSDLFDLSGDVAVVTGAGRGIGEGIATTLAAAGAATIRERGGRAIAVPTDVTDRGAVEALAQQAVDELGGLDIWVNNAGGSPVQAPLAVLDTAEWDATIRLNLTAVWMCTTVAAQHMGDGGRVVNISSKAATTPMPGSGHYGAAKAAVNSLTQTFAKELGPRIRVNCIMPGAVPTEIMMTALRLTDDDLPGLERMLRLPMGRLGERPRTSGRRCSTSRRRPRLGSRARCSPSTAGCEQVSGITIKKVVALRSCRTPST